MISRFLPKQDILIRHRQDAVQSYMEPGAQQRMPHFHYQYELLLSVGGTADFVIGGQLYHAAPGTVLFMSNMENHYIRAHSEGYDRYTLRFSTELLSAYLCDPQLLSVFKQRPEKFSHQYVCASQEFAHYLHLAARMEAEYNAQSPYWDQMIASKLLTILVGMFRAKPESFPAYRNPDNQNLIFDVQNYIEAHVQEDLRLDTIAEKFYISKYHLSHSFTRLTGYTFKQFIVTARLSKSKDLLLNTEAEIGAISRAVGFNNVSSFIRTFKKAEGLPPLQYRNRARRPKG